MGVKEEFETEIKTLNEMLKEDKKNNPRMTQSDISYFWFFTYSTAFDNYIKKFKENEVVDIVRKDALARFDKLMNSNPKKSDIIKEIINHSKLLNLNIYSKLISEFPKEEGKGKLND